MKNRIKQWDSYKQYRLDFLKFLRDVDLELNKLTTQQVHITTLPGNIIALQDLSRKLTTGQQTLDTLNNFKSTLPVSAECAVLTQRLENVSASMQTWLTLLTRLSKQIKLYQEKCSLLQHKYDQLDKKVHAMKDGKKPHARTMKDIQELEVRKTSFPYNP